MFLYGRSSNCDNEFIFPVHSWITSHLPFDVDLDHLRRIYTEEKAKVVTAVWGTEFIQVLATLAILHPNEFKNSMNSSFSSCPPGAIHPFLHIILSPKEQRRPLPSLLYKSFFCSTRLKVHHNYAGIIACCMLKEKQCVKCNRSSV